MRLRTHMADELVRAHPERAAAVLEPLDAAAAAAVLGRQPSEAAGEVLRHMAPHAARAVLTALPPERAGALLGALDLDTGARLLRGLTAERAEPVLAALPSRRARALRSLLAFREGTAGALMDPEVLALPGDLTAEQALARVREAADHARYNLYVLDRDGRLTGVLNLRELLLAPPRARLTDVMVPDPRSLPADAPRSAVVSHPGWQEVHALPVVDPSGVYLGAVRYRTLRELEQARPGPLPAGADTAAALGDLFAAGALGVLEALAGGERTRGGGSTGGGDGA